MASLLHKTKQNLTDVWVLAGIVGGIAYISATSTWTPAHVGFVVAGILILAVLLLALNSAALDKPLSYLLTAGIIAYLGYEIVAHEWSLLTSTSTSSIVLDALIVFCIVALGVLTLGKIRNRQR